MALIDKLENIEKTMEEIDDSMSSIKKTDLNVDSVINELQNMDLPEEEGLDEALINEDTKEFKIKLLQEVAAEAEQEK